MHTCLETSHACTQANTRTKGELRDENPFSIEECLMGAMNRAARLALARLPESILAIVCNNGMPDLVIKSCQPKFPKRKAPSKHFNVP